MQCCITLCRRQTKPSTPKFMPRSYKGCVARVHTLYRRIRVFGSAKFISSRLGMPDYLVVQIEHGCTSRRQVRICTTAIVGITLNAVKMECHERSSTCIHQLLVSHPVLRIVGGCILLWWRWRGWCRGRMCQAMAIELMAVLRLNAHPVPLPTYPHVPTSVHVALAVSCTQLGSINAVVQNQLPSTTWQVAIKPKTHPI